MAIDLIGPDGQEYVFDNPDPAALDEVLRQGYKQPVAKYEPQTTGEKILQAGADVADVAGAGAFGVLQGITGGLAGAALGADSRNGPTSLQEEIAAEVQRKTEKGATATAYMAGNVAGTILSPLNKLAAPIRGGIGTTTALGRIGAEGLAQGAVGTLFGAGNTLSEAALGNQDLTAEKLIAGIGLGGLLGIAGGVAGAGLGEAIGAVAPVVGKAVGRFKDPLLEIRDLFGMKAAGAMGKDFKAAAYRDNTRELVDLLIEKGVMKAGGTLDDVADSAVKLAQETGEAQGALAKALEAKGAKVDGAKVASELDTLAAKYSSGNVGDQSIGKRLAAEAEALRARGEMPFTAAEEAKRGFDKFLEFGAEQGPMQEGLKKARGLLNKEIEAAANAADEVGAAQWLKAKKEMGLLAQVRDFSTARAEALKANRFLSLSDHLVGGAGLVSGAIAGGDENRLQGALAGAALGFGNKVLRQRLPSLIAKAADAIANSAQLSMAAKSFSGQMQLATPHLGEYAAPILQAMGRSPAHALATHIAMAQTIPAYAEKAKAAGFLPETPEEEASAIGRAGSMAGIAQKMQEQNAQLEKKLKKVIKGAPRSSESVKEPAPRRTRQESEKAHQRRMNEIRSLASDPEALLDRVIGTTGHASAATPGIAGAIARTAQTAVTFLAAQFQEPPKAGPLAANWVVSEAELYDFSEVLQVVQNPLSVLDAAVAGTLGPKQVAAFQTVYPLLARQVADMALQEMVDGPKDVPYRARLMLGLLTGTDPDGSIGLTASNQAAIHASHSKPSNQGSPTGPKSELSLASRTAMPGERRDLTEA